MGISRWRIDRTVARLAVAGLANVLALLFVAGWMVGAHMLSPPARRTAAPFVAGPRKDVETTPVDEPDAADDLAARLAAYHPQTGTVRVGDVAQVQLDDGWLFLGGRDGRTFLTELGNPNVGNWVLGVALPPDFADSGVFAVYSYDDEGHVHDDEEPDYGELLQQMQER